MTNRFMFKLAALVVAGGTLMQLGGCSLNSLLRNVWTGFGYGIGGLPADLVTTAIRGAFGLN